MNIFMKACDEIRFRIPKEILKEVFTDKIQHWKDVPISIEEQIINKVIKNRVLVDCNLVGGTEAMIPLEGLMVEMIDNFTSVYHIPKSRSQGRSIMSVLSVTFTSASMMAQMGALGGVNPCSVTPTLSAGMAMMDSNSPIPMSSTARVQLIAENTVMIRDTSPIVINGYLRCILANDENLSHIQMRAIPPFCKLVEYAVKSYIYNESIIIMDMGRLSGGMELGRYKEVVDSYADAEEMYQDYLITKWSKIALFSDRESWSRLIRMQIGAMR